MSAPARRASVDVGEGGQPRDRRWRWLAVDAAAILVLLSLVAVAFLPTYGTWWLFATVLGFGLLGIGVALLGARRRWRAGQIMLAAVGGWFLIGTPLVMPSAGIAGFVPTARSLRGLATGPVTAWRDMLTLQPPIGETGNLLAAPAAAALVAALLATLISLRSRHPTLAWLPLAVAWALAVTLGSSVAILPVAVGALFFVVLLLWTSHRRATGSAVLVGGTSRPLLVRGALGALALLVAGALAVAAVPLLAPAAPRVTARQAVEPPIDIEAFTSPLQAFRANVTKHEDTVLLEVRGVEEGEFIRVATLDRYDGVSFNVATTQDDDAAESTFTRVGEWIADDTEGPEAEIGVTVHGYDGVWVPTVGRTTQIRFDGDREVALAENFYYNHDSGTGITLAGLQPSDSYSLEAVTPQRPGDEEIAEAAAGTQRIPADSGVPDELRELAHTWGDGPVTAGAKALALEKNLHDGGWFSHGQAAEAHSNSGHSGARLATLVAKPETMVGDGEQYAPAMVLMARELGIPARVVYGYRANGTSSVTGGDVGTRAELQLDGLGWVAFDPTPPEGQVLPEEEAPQPPKLQPHVQNPPPPPQEPENPPADDELPIDPGEPPAVDTPIDWAAIGVWMALGGIPLLTIVVPIALVVGLKMRRRTRRRNHPELGNRVAGAWSELVDRARDLGRSPSPAATRTEQAEQFVGDFPNIRPRADPVGMSRQADWLVFAPEDPAPEVVAGYWEDTRQVERGLRRSVSWPRWVLSKLSTKSFRTLK